MRHPALTRVFAIVLAVFGLVMLLAGAMGLGRAASDRQRSLNDAARLRARLSDYQQALLALDGSGSYQALSDELSTRQEQHDEDAAQHRIDLATYTATQGGIAQGVEALDEADAAFAVGQAQYEAGLAAFEEQAAAFEQQYALFQQGKAELESSAQQVNAIAALLNAAMAELNALQQLPSMPDASELPTIPGVPDDPSLPNDLELPETVDPAAARAAALSAFDAELAALDRAPALIDGLKAQGGVSADQVQAVLGAIEQLTGEPLGIEAQAITPEMLDQIDVGAIRQTVAEQRSAVESMSDDEIVAQYGQIREAYAGSQGGVQGAIALLSGQLAEYQAQLTEAQAQLAEAQAQMAQAEALMEQGRLGIEQGRAALEEAGRQIAAGGQALYDARAQIWYEMGKQEDKQEELREERDLLEADAEELAGLNEQAEDLKQRKQRERSLRLMLLDRDEVAGRVDAGESLAAATEAVIAELEQTANEQYGGRRLAYLLMVVGGVLAFAAIPAAFERIRARWALLLPVLLCFCCAAAAEILCLSLGRGNSYSALAGAGFALVQLLVSFPKIKA